MLQKRFHCIILLRLGLVKQAVLPQHSQSVVRYNVSSMNSVLIYDSVIVMMYVICSYIGMCYDRMRLYSTLFSWFMFPNSSKSPLLPPSKQGSPMIVPVYNVTLASWLHKSPKIRLFVSKLILSKKPIKSLHYWPFVVGIHWLFCLWSPQ